MSLNESVGQTGGSESVIRLVRPSVVVLCGPAACGKSTFAGRERSVGQPVVERQYQMFEQAKSSIAQEGFDQIVELRGAGLDKVRIEIVFRPAPRVAAGPPRP